MKRKREIFTENEFLETAREEMVILKSEMMNYLHYYQSIILSLQKEETDLLANITNSVSYSFAELLFLCIIFPVVIK